MHISEQMEEEHADKGHLYKSTGMKCTVPERLMCRVMWPITLL